MQTIEERLDQLEKRNRRLTAALTVTVVAMCAVVTMAATGEKDGTFDVVTARHIAVTNSAGEALVTLGADFIGNGTIYTFSAKGKTLVFLSSTDHNEGLIETRQGGSWWR